MPRALSAVQIAVIGSGLGGLSAAIRLQKLGHRVTIYEKRDQPGGRAGVFQRDGFTFDAGPTIITAPHLIDELFEFAGERRSDHVDFVQLDPAYNIRFGDGTVFHYATDRARMRDEVARFSPSDVAGYDAFARETTRILDAAMPLIDEPFLSMTSMARALPDLLRLGAHRTAASLAQKHFRDERLRQVFSFHPLLLGGNPFTATVIYAMIPALEMKWGVWFARGGTGALVRAMVAVFEKLGGKVEYDREVERIRVNGLRSTVSGLKFRDGEYIECDAVVSNADAAHTYMHLLRDHERTRWTTSRVMSRKHSMSLVVLYFGTRRRYEQMAHHEILMGPRYEALLHDVFHRKVLAPDFSLYLHRPTATDTSLAPAGCDAWYALSPVPNLEGPVRWESEAKRYRDAILGYLEKEHLPGLSGQLVSESMIDPRYFRDELNSYAGSGFSFEPRLTQSAWFRPHNRSEELPNLYLTGAGTHPGAGIPGVISSGKIVANLIGSSRD